jgi:hypothetical protein
MIGRGAGGQGAGGWDRQMAPSHRKSSWRDGSRGQGGGARERQTLAAAPAGPARWNLRRKCPRRNGWSGIKSEERDGGHGGAALRSFIERGMGEGRGEPFSAGQVRNSGRGARWRWRSPSSEAGRSAVQCVAGQGRGWRGTRRARGQTARPGRGGGGEERRSEGCTVEQTAAEREGGTASSCGG